MTIPKSEQLDERGVASSTKAAPRFSFKAKPILGLAICLAFFATLEAALFLLGVKSLATDGDPLAGFSGGFRLFEERQGAAVSQVATAANRLTYFNDQSFPARKAKNAYRIFCIGGSTTYGRPYDDQTSFAGFLRATLPELDSQRDWEVVNAGGISYGSTRIALLMRELVRYEPDLFVVYTGHNEFLEEQTFSSVIHTPESVLSLGAIAARVRTFSVVHRLVHGSQSSSQESEAATSDEVDALLDRSVGPGAYHRDDTMRQTVMAQFGENLKQIVTLGQNAGARVVLVTPAANLRDCRPFKSEYQNALTGQQISKHRALYQSATDAFEAGNHQLALQNVTAAVDIDERHAATQFLRGRILWAKGEWNPAREAFRLAREEDICPLRAPQQISEVIRDIAASLEVPLIDFEQQISSVATHDVPGDDWFLDHVHPTIAGHELLARNVLEELIDAGIASPNAEWNEESFEQVAAAVRQQIDPQKHAVALRNLAKVLGWAGKAEEADRLAVKAAELLADDSESQTMAGFAALRSGDLAKANTLFQAALKIDSRNVRAIDGLGSALSASGQFAAASDCFSTAVRLDPKHVPSWFNLGNAARQMGQLEKAVNAYQQALRLVPEQPDAHKNLGLVRLAQGQFAAAIQELQMAQTLDPRTPERYTDLGFVFFDAGELQRAEQSFQAAAKIAPESIPAMIGLALVKERQQNFAGAEEILRRGLIVDPHNIQLRDLLQEVRSRVE